MVRLEALELLTMNSPAVPLPRTAVPERVVAPEPVPVRRSDLTVAALAPRAQVAAEPLLVSLRTLPVKAPAIVVVPESARA